MQQNAMTWIECWARLRDLKGILVSLDKIKELLKFVWRTSRFKTTLGDAIGDVSHLEPIHMKAELLRYFNRV